MGNKRQLTAALMIATILGTAMPLSAEVGGGQKSTCAYIEGMAVKTTGNFLKFVLPDHVVDNWMEKWGCE